MHRNAKEAKLERRGESENENCQEVRYVGCVLCPANPGEGVTVDYSYI